MNNSKTSKYIYRSMILFLIFYLTSLIILFFLRIQSLVIAEDFSLRFVIFIIFIFLIFCMLILFISFLFLSNQLVINVSLTSFITIFLLLSFELFFENTRKNADLRLIERYKVAKYQGIDFDKRSSLEVIDALNKKNITAYPNLKPKNYIDEEFFANIDLLPLGGISNSFTIFENENGKYPIIKLDKFGFANLTDNYNSPLDIVLIGDSFTEGYSVDQNYNIVSNLNNSNFKSLSIAKAGNGPLAQYASYIEYVKKLKPKNIIWLFHTNDFNDLKNEINSDILKKYIDIENFNQKLIQKQTYINKILKNFLEQKMYDKINFDRIKEKEKIKFNINFFRIIKFTNIRNKIKMLINKKSEIEVIDKELIEIFDKIMKIVKYDLDSWNGKLYFFYLPSQKEFKLKSEDISKKYVKSIMTIHKIPFIDISELFYSQSKNPLEFFPFEMPGHYNELGYKKISNKIIQVVK